MASSPITWRNTGGNGGMSAASSFMGNALRGIGAAQDTANDLFGGIAKGRLDEEKLAAQQQEAQELAGIYGTTNPQELAIKKQALLQRIGEGGAGSPTNAMDLLGAVNSYENTLLDRENKRATTQNTKARTKGTQADTIGTKQINVSRPTELLQKQKKRAIDIYEQEERAKHFKSNFAAEAKVNKVAGDSAKEVQDLTIADMKSKIQAGDVSMLHEVAKMENIPKALAQDYKLAMSKMANSRRVAGISAHAQISAARIRASAQRAAAKASRTASTGGINRGSFFGDRVAGVQAQLHKMAEQYGGDLAKIPKEIMAEVIGSSSKNPTEYTTLNGIVKEYIKFGGTANSKRKPYVTSLKGIKGKTTRTPIIDRLIKKDNVGEDDVAGLVSLKSQLTKVINLDGKKYRVKHSGLPAIESYVKENYTGVNVFDNMQNSRAWMEKLRDDGHLMSVRKTPKRKTSKNRTPKPEELTSAQMTNRLNVIRAKVEAAKREEQ